MGSASLRAVGLLALCLVPSAAAWSAVGGRACQQVAGIASSSSSAAAVTFVGDVTSRRAAVASRAPAPTMGGRGRGRYNRAPPPPRDTTPYNEAIQFEEMRVMIDMPGEADEMLGVMSKSDALEAARERDLDLVLVAKGDPPICKIVSYDKYRFAKEKKKKEQSKAASKGQELKELKMSYNIGEHDSMVRKKQALKFLQQGNKVKFSMLFRGREVTHADVGKEVMLKMADSLEDIGVLDSPPRVFGRQMIMLISPKPTK